MNKEIKKIYKELSEKTKKKEILGLTREKKRLEKNINEIDERIEFLANLLK